LNSESADTDAEIGNAPWSQCRVLGQIGGLFVVLETEDGMVLMDPHAAHERVMYEKFMDQVHNGAVQSQGLLCPETVDMPPENAAMIRRHEQTLHSMGFGISSFGGDSFIIDSIPSCLGKVSVAEVIDGLAKAAERGGAKASVEHGAQERIAMAACKAAVKGGDKLTLGEIERLVNDLARTRMPYTCPHGRPTLIFMGFRELQKKFGRITP
jgi:DNA mismatch repair protein MutL